MDSNHHLPANQMRFVSPSRQIAGCCRPIQLHLRMVLPHRIERWLSGLEHPCGPSRELIGASTQNRTEVLNLEGSHNSHYTILAHGAPLENRTLLSGLQNRCIATMLAGHMKLCAELNRFSRSLSRMTSRACCRYTIAAHGRLSRI